MKTFLATLMTALFLWPVASVQGEQVALIQVNGAISPATAGYISRSIGEAVSLDAQCLIIQLDTPGGLLASTKDIVQRSSY